MIFIVGYRVAANDGILVVAISGEQVHVIEGEVDHLGGFNQGAVVEVVFMNCEILFFENHKAIVQNSHW